MNVTRLRFPAVILNCPPEDKFCPNKRHQFAGTAESPEQVAGYLQLRHSDFKGNHLLTRSYGRQFMFAFVLRSLRD